MKIFAGVYLILLVASIAFPFFAGGPEAGIYAVILSLPWSLLLATLLDSIGPATMDSFGVYVPVVGGLINLLLLGAVIRRGRPRSTSA